MSSCMGCIGTRCWLLHKGLLNLGDMAIVLCMCKCKWRMLFRRRHACMHALARLLMPGKDAKLCLWALLPAECTLGTRRATRCLACTGRVYSIFQTVRVPCPRGWSEPGNVCRRCPAAVLSTDVLPNVLWAFRACRSAQNASRRCQ